MTSQITKAIVAAAGAALLLGVTACGSPADAEAVGGDSLGLVGIAMPAKSLERWNKDGARVEGLLQDAGYDTDLQFADNQASQQVAQITHMLEQDLDALVVAAVDGSSLAPVLAEAKAKGVIVIAYDRLINGTGDVDYYATFDNYEVGKLQGRFIVEQLDLRAGTGPFNLEPFAGSPDDNNAKLFFSGAWDVLGQYVANGQLVVPSGKAPASNDDWASIGIEGWTSEAAQAELASRLESSYGSTKVDVVLSPNDSLALGITQALLAAGYTEGEGWPLITGQDADQINVENMVIGRQAMTVWKDTRTLADQAATMVTQALKGSKVTVNDEVTYNNGVKIVPTYQLPPVVVTKDSIKDTLLDSGFYKPEDVGL
ncbi:sugar ABC transporter substrate-binding protein [Cellulomonas cellasea]|uniref:substrate-binding domain-containing protein n=1 Tax=Cellulomonas cellasea TaxID=43670 RepID=UPI0025A43101|nr:sugar-binding protein [Cellulomonas cellasea]MDM8083488.1 sugar ABC transporter substrate-binding protein [Cellulomonas cellasea]